MTNIIKLISILTFCLQNVRSELAIDSSSEQNGHIQCELIQGECTGLGYRYTSSSYTSESDKFANQRAADAFIKSFALLEPCSAYFKIFLCGTYKPSCHEEVDLIVKPCRSMCEHVYGQCYPLMRRFGIGWRADFNCSRFPKDSSESCMQDPGYSKDGKSINDYLSQVDNLIGKTIFFIIS